MSKYEAWWDSLSPSTKEYLKSQPDIAKSIQAKYLQKYIDKLKGLLFFWK